MMIDDDDDDDNDDDDDDNAGQIDGDSFLSDLRHKDFHNIWLKYIRTTSADVSLAVYSIAVCWPFLAELSSDSLRLD